MAESPPVICLMGATATGKTDLAVKLCRRLPCDIISVDSALIYRGMDIGTAKPGSEVLMEAPHRLIDIRDPAETYSAAEFRRDALAEIATIHDAGRIPLLVGGTMLYFKALLEGLAPLPKSDPDLRQRLLVEAETEGLDVLHARLAEVDPTAAARIHANDPQRLQRALEVFELTGRPLSELIAEQEAARLPFRALQLGVEVGDRALLHRRIAARFHQMLESGFEAEVRGLLARGDLDIALPSIRCVGYRQMWEYLRGNWDYEQMIDRGIIATRQLAKRQITWLRGWRGLNRLDACDPYLEARALKLIDDYLI